MTSMTRILSICLLLILAALPHRAAAQIYVFTNDCDGGVLAGRVASILTGEILGQRTVARYELGAPSAVPGHILQPGEDYQISYEIFPRCSDGIRSQCSAVTSFDMSLRHMAGNRFPDSLRRDGTEQRHQRMPEQTCFVKKRVTFGFKAPFLRPDPARPGPLLITAGVCPPHAKFQCSVHRIRVVPVERHAGWEISGVNLNTSTATPGTAFSVSARITNQTGRNAWPGGRASMWVNPPLNPTPRRIESREVPALQNGTSHVFRANVPGMSAGRHMFQVCFGPVGETDYDALKCGPRSAIRVR